MGLQGKSGLTGCPWTRGQPGLLHLGDGPRPGPHGIGPPRAHDLGSPSLESGPALRLDRDQQDAKEEELSRAEAEP